MIMVKKKYVYEVNSLLKYYGMMPLDVYVTMTYFNYATNKGHEDVMLSLGELSHFITECIIEAVVSHAKIDVNNLDFSAKDIYISGVPSLSDALPNRVMVLNLKNRKLFISEMRMDNNEGIKMQDMPKEKLLPLMLAIHQLALTLMNDVLEKCKSAKKLSIVGVDEQEDEASSDKSDKSDDQNEKFNLKNYERL